MMPEITIKGRHTVLDYLFFIRPVLLPPVWSIALLGAATIRPVAVSPWYWVAFFTQLAFLFGAVYTLNQLYDVESDRANRKLFFLPEGMIPILHALAFTVVLDLSALALAFIFNWTYVILTTAIILLGILYSAGRHPWKNNPIAGFLANVVAHGLIVYAMGIAFAGADPLWFWRRAHAYALAVGGVYLATTVADAVGDRLAHKKTIAVMLGPGATMQLALLMVLGAAAIAVWRRDWWLAIPAICVLPVFGRATLSEIGTWAPRAAKVGVFALTIAAVVAYPWYLLVLISGFFGTRLFFRWRFGMTYPSFL